MQIFITCRQVNRYHSNAANKFRNMTKEERRENAIAIIKDLPDDQKRLNGLEETLMENLSHLQNVTFAHVKFSLYRKYMECEETFSQVS